MNEKQKQEVLEYYLLNEMGKLKRLCFPIMAKLGGISQKDEDDFYSLASIVLWKTLDSYDETTLIPFEAFFRSCLKKRFITELRDRNRDNRKANNGKYVCSIDNPNEDGQTLANLIVDKHTTEEIFEEKKIEYSDKMEKYLNKLSTLQKKVLELISIGFQASEIQKDLHISSKEYSDSIINIRSYRNTSILTKGSKLL